MRKCFIVSPIGTEGSDTRKEADKLFKHVIKPVCEICEFDPVRVDQMNDANSITQTIIEQLDTADLVIADMTEHNPNVFYEMGYRYRTKKPMIHLRKKGEVIPFDVTTIRTLEYDLTDLDSVEEVRDRLQKTIESFVFSDSGEQEVEEEPTDSVATSIIPILYELLDMMKEVKAEVKNFSTDTIATVVRSMQPAQPQISPDTALQMQLMSGLMQNPDGFLKILEVSEKINKQGKK